MKLTYDVIKIIMLYLLVFLIIICIVQFPRDIRPIPSQKQHFIMTFDYQFSWAEYKDNILQYIKAIILHGDLGKTINGTPVTETITEYMPRSLRVIIPAFLISIPLGLLKGIFDFRHSKRKLRIMGQGSTFLMLALPDFFLIIMLQWLIITIIPGLKFLAFGYEHWYNSLLPAFLVLMYPVFYFARMTTAALDEQEGKQYVQVAKSKGFTERFVLYKHMLANCWSTLISHLPTGMVYVLSNLLIVEYLMDYKGGAYRLFKAFHYSQVLSIGHNIEFEPDVILGFSSMFIIIMFLIHLLSIILSHIVDPRV